MLLALLPLLVGCNGASFNSMASASMAEVNGSSGASYSAEPRPKKTMTILSFNMRQWTRDTDSSQPSFWRNRMEAMEKMIEDVNPDVICFQEFMAPVGRYVPKAYSRVGITASHPIYVRKGLNVTDHSVAIYHESCDVDGVCIINVHSRWESEVLEKTVRQVEAKLTGCDVACGDWNNGLATIQKHELKMKSARALLGIDESQDTFANFKRPDKSHGAIDHFFVRGVKPVEYRMITEDYGTKISDHYPIVLKISY